ncbi:triose-phosphate transporter family-domain-containing protein [Fomitopsis serialis]|uniref:triose-phosphate transporter family-domain-containing protein n=1 Tax=Fomitopsis serialis TaxID=139415 RepID=UPI0020086116|nr:triose-phosphate transporter family-domain-containing protein [Neoantrodia serialis]KAH9920106.1 triose-phosphate transporter family-domain-containing protein [Neoantrodia serialis]
MALEPASNGYAPVDSAEDGYQHSRSLSGDVHLASVAEKRRLWRRNALINAALIACWFLFATVLSVYNKWMFSPDRFGFPSPLFVTTLHMAVQFLLATLLRTCWPLLFRPQHSPNRADYLRRAVPTGVATSLDIGLSNLSLKLITLSFYTMCKTSSLIFVLFFAFLFRLEVFSLRLVGVMSLIFIGVILMVATETHFELTGFLLVEFGSALAGFRWSLTQLLLRSKNIGFDNPAATLFWLTPIMGATLAILTLIVDGPHKVFWSEFLRTLFFLISPGIIAFCMVLSEFYILQRAGIVPMSIAGIAKEVTTISASAWFFGDELTPLNLTGVSITICGIGLYTYHKYRRSMDATVPLDAHGNPIIDTDQGGDADSSMPLQEGFAEEREPLAADSDLILESGAEDRRVPRHPNGSETLFDVGSEDEEERLDHGTAHKP